MTHHLMIDIETLDRKPSAVVLALAARFFDPGGDVLNSHFVAPVNIRDQALYGRTIDANTLQWWFDQDSFLTVTKKSIHAQAALQLLNNYVDKNTEHRDQITVWSKSPAFDIVILKSLADDMSCELPWHRYYNERDVRTILDVAEIKTDRKRVTHNPIDDVNYQIAQVQEAWQKIRS